MILATHADIDRDGASDLVVADGLNITVARSLRNGSFEIGQSLAGGANVAALVAADVNQDGLPDVLASLSQRVRDNLAVFLNEGGGSFSRPRFYITLAGVRSIDTGDVDGDGFLDVGVASAFETEFLFLFGDGKGAFAEQAALQMPFVQTVTMADLDGDALADTVLQGVRGIDIVAGNSSRQWSASDVSRSSSLATERARVVDLDGDGDASDIAALRVGFTSGLIALFNHGRTSDRDGDGMIDSCDGAEQFVRGDVDGDARRTISDSIATLLFLFGGGRTPSCLDAADVDDSGSVNNRRPDQLTRVPVWQWGAAARSGTGLRGRSNGRCVDLRGFSRLLSQRRPDEGEIRARQA